MSNEKKTLNKKLIAIIAVLLAVVIAVSVIFVVKNKNANEEETTTETTTVEETTVADVETEKTTVLKTETTEAPTKRKTVKEFVEKDLGFKNPIITKGHKVQNGIVYFVDEPMADATDFFENRFIIVDTGEKFIIKEMFNGMGKPGCYFADVDGEKGEEIIVHMDTGGSGGYGSYVSYVFKVDEGKILTLFDSETDNIFKNAFESRLESPFKAVVYCKDVGYEKTLDLKDWDASDMEYIYDAEGNPIDYDYVVNFDSFYKFEPKDVDKDGIFEVVCRQYASLGSHVSCVGFTELVLSFDDHDEIISAKFTEGPDKSFGYQG